MPQIDGLCGDWGTKPKCVCLLDIQSKGESNAHHYENSVSDKHELSFQGSATSHISSQLEFPMNIRIFEYGGHEPNE